MSAMKFWQHPRQPFIGLAFVAAVGILIADRLPLNPLPVAIALAIFALPLARWPFAPAAWLFAGCAFFALHNFHNFENPGRALSRELSFTRKIVRASGIVIGEPEAAEDIG